MPNVKNNTDIAEQLTVSYLLNHINQSSSKISFEPCGLEPGAKEAARILINHFPTIVDAIHTGKNNYSDRGDICLILKSGEHVDIETKFPVANFTTDANMGCWLFCYLTNDVIPSYMEFNKITRNHSKKI